jgi:hypothetical protein
MPSPPLPHRSPSPPSCPPLRLHPKVYGSASYTRSTTSCDTSTEIRQRSGSRLSWGLAPSSRHTLRESTRLPRPIARPGPLRASPMNRAVFRPQAFSASRRFDSSRNCAALFHAAATCRVRLPPGGFPSRQPHQTRRLAVPSCRYETHLPETEGRNLRLPSMRPFDFRALLRLKVRSLGADVTLSRGPIPSWDFSFLFRASPRPCRAALPLGDAAPLMPFAFRARSAFGCSGPEGLSPLLTPQSLGPWLQRLAGQGAWPVSFENRHTRLRSLRRPSVHG